MNVNEYLDVINPATSAVIGKAALSIAAAVDATIDI
jgi:acyl-CoA reductase-like NAD-dependent aldehyde dehydrogenase